MNFYTLIYIGSKQINTNLKGKKNSDIYIDLACQLYKSLRLGGNNLTILSNKKQYIVKYLKRNYKFKIIVEEIHDTFAKTVPDFTKFKAAHAKIDCFKYFANLDSLKPVFLIDSDVLLLRNFPSWFNTELLSTDHIYGYDITRQLVTGYGKKVVDADLKLFLKQPLTEWYGGEIIGASPVVFKSIYEKSKNIFKIYLKNLKKLNHIGDETIFNAALQSLDLKVIDLGSLNIIERKWSSPCFYDQLPLNTINKISLIHMPSSKSFISNLPIVNFKTIKIFLILFFSYSYCINLIKKFIKFFM